MIAPYLPYPFRAGGYVRLYNLIKHLSDEHEITLLSYIRTSEEIENIPHLSRYCRHVEVIRRRKPRSLFNILLSLFSRYPIHAVVNGFSKEMRAKIIELVKCNNFNIIHVEHYHMASAVLNLRHVLNVPLILGEQGVEFLVYNRHFKTRKNPVVRFLGQMEARRIRSYEIATIRQFDACLEVSEQDLKFIKPLIPDMDFSVVSNGVDCSFYCPDGNRAVPNLSTVDLDDHLKIIFVGTFRFFGNVDAVLHFHRDILPFVRSQIPNVKLYAIGADPPDEVLRLRSDDVIVTGFLSIEEYKRSLASGDVFIAPLRSGSGTKLKIFEAMAMEKAVVTTSIGIEGIEAVPDEHVVVADTPKEFAKEIVRLLSDANLRKYIGKQAREFVRNRYDWKPIAVKLAKVYSIVSEKYYEKLQSNG